MARAFDVAVVGGGSAGVAAAVSAARTGARTLLVERGDVLGGNASLAFVHTICGLYREADGAPPVPAHFGLPRRLAAELTDAGGAGAPERAGRMWVLPIEPPRFAELLRAWCARTPGLECMTGTELVGASLGARADDECELALHGGGGPGRIRARAVVDASGDAEAAALAGADWEMAPPDRLQIPSFIFRMGGVDRDRLQGFGRLRLTRAVAEAARHRALPAECESVLVRPARAEGEIYVTLNVPRPENRPFAPLDEKELGVLGAQARAWADAVAAFLRDTREAFRGARVVAWPRQLGVRETRRGLGRVVLEERDVLDGRRRDDEVALSTWPVELWHEHRRAEWRHPSGPCSIPLAALASRSHPRLALAGRCLSASHEALGALRVIGTALATGEAAGVAAALAVDAGCALGEVDPARVRERIAALAERELA